MVRPSNAIQMISNSIVGSKIQVEVARYGLRFRCSGMARQAALARVRSETHGMDPT